MRVESVRDLAAAHGLRLPDSLRSAYPPELSAADERGWFRFQRLYDAARHCVHGEADMRRIVREAAHDDGAEGSRWLEIQVDPTSYAGPVGGITPAMEMDNVETIKRAVELGLGISVLPLPTVQQEVNTGTLVNGADLGGATDNAAYGSAT